MHPTTTTVAADLNVPPAAPPRTTCMHPATTTVATDLHVPTPRPPRTTCMHPATTTVATDLHVPTPALASTSRRRRTRGIDELAIGVDAFTRS